MSRSGYSEDCDEWALIRWRGAVNSAIKGKRGQKFLTEMAQALDAMPVKRLIADELITSQGEVCALGAVAKHKCLKVEGVSPDDRERVAEIFNISGALAAEIAFENDDGNDWGYDRHDTPERRWIRMRKWVDENLKSSPHPER